MAPKPLVALTGGTGFVGSHLADGLLAGGYRVRALLRRPASPGWLERTGVEIVAGDVREALALDAFVAGADAVIHAAGKTSAKNEAEYFASNAGGTANVVAATLRSAPAAQLVLVSSQAAGGPSLDGLPVSASAPGHPVSSYGRSKLAAEGEVRKATMLPWTILRPSVVYGPRDTAVRGLFVSASRGVVPVLAGGRTRIQFVYVGDLVRSVLGAIRRGGRQETFYVAHPEVLDYGRIAETLARLPARQPLLLPIPRSVIRAAGWAVGLATAFSSAPPIFDEEKADEVLQPAWLCYVGDAQVALDQPFETDFATGSRITWNWYVERGWIRGDTIPEAENPNATSPSGASRRRG